MLIYCFSSKYCNFFWQQKLPSLKFGKEKIHKSGLMKLPACHIFSDNLYVVADIRYPALPDILPDIRYPAFYVSRISGRPDIAGQISIRCIPKLFSIIDWLKTVNKHKVFYGMLFRGSQ
jgi:hypothetical protein